MANITDADLDNVTALSIGNLRNGSPDQMVTTAREASIPAEYYNCVPLWEAVFAGDVNTRVPGIKPAVFVNIGIRTYYAKICEAKVAASRAAFDATGGNNAGNQGGNAAGNPAGPAAPPNVFNEDEAWGLAKADDQIRKCAIAIGSATAAVILGYRISRNHVNAAEIGAAIYDVDPAGPTADEDAYNAALRTSNSGWSARLASGNNANNMTPLETAAQEMASMTAVERAASGMFFILATAAPSRAGAMLMKTLHHYLSDANNRRRHLACENQVRIGEDNELRTYLNTFLDKWRDMVWHKSIHWVKRELLEEIAADPVTAQRLSASGYGSFAVGLPAQEDMISRSGSYVALYNACSSDISQAGHIVEIKKLVSMYNVFTTMPRNVIGTVIPAWEGKAAGQFDANVRTRTDAVERFLKVELERVAGRAAWMFGWYRSVAERLNIAENTREGSLLRSYSLRKTLEAFMPMASQGAQAYAAYRRFTNAMAEKGELVSYRLTDEPDSGASTAP